MKSILTSLVLAACCVPIGMGVAQVVSAFKEAPQAHEFANLNTPLWTNTPIQVDHGNQPYERLPAVMTAATETPRVAIRRANDVAEAGASVSLAAGVPTQQAEIEQTRVAWCSDRYSSYRIEDNTYQPFGGGPRRACQAPQPVAGGAVAQASMPQATGDLAEAHVRWCFNRYSSYQAADNSYRAFSGVRRQCASPFADPASESLQASR